MTQFFNHEQAEAFVEEIDGQFPGIEFDVSDVFNPTTQEYGYSYIALVADHHCFATFGTSEEFDRLLKGATLLAQAIADNQQNEEVERGRSFTDQNGFTVVDGGVYGVDEHGNLYDLESQEVFRPSEY